jgi:crossover junction endodeoxyribonuclease RusA
VIIELPFPPSLNSYWRHIVIKGRARTLISKRGREYKKDVTDIATGICEKLTGRLRVFLYLYPPTKRVTDCDNYAKAVLDALTDSGVWGDDSQIDELTIRREEVTRGGKLVVRIEVING